MLPKSIDGSHHKTWVLDQMSRILKGTPVEIVLAKWDNGEEEYHDWVAECRGKWIKSNSYEGWEYDYDEGIAPLMNKSTFGCLF